MPTTEAECQRTKTSSVATVVVVFKKPSDMLEPLTNAWRNIGRQCHAIDQDQGIDIGSRSILVGLTGHEAVLRDEVVVAPTNRK